MAEGLRLVNHFAAGVHADNPEALEVVLLGMELMMLAVHWSGTADIEVVMGSHYFAGVLVAVEVAKSKTEEACCCIAVFVEADNLYLAVVGSVVAAVVAVGFPEQLEYRSNIRQLP